MLKWKMLSVIPVMSTEWSAFPQAKKEPADFRIIPIMTQECCEPMLISQKNSVDIKMNRQHNVTK
jgi:hypothetical protein